MSESIQKKLLRVKPPRIKITYDLETEGASIARELPVVFGIIGDYSGNRNPDEEFTNYQERNFVFLDPDNFNEVLKSFKPRVVLSIPEKEKNENSVNIIINFESLEDFSPLNLVKKIDFLYEKFQEKKKLNEISMKSNINHKIGDFLDKIKNDSNFKDLIKNQATNQSGEDIDNMFNETHFCHQTNQKPYAYDLILNYINVLEKNLVSGDNYNSFIINYIVYIDEFISYYLNLILHSKEFQKLESSWRGLDYFIKNSEFNNLKVRVFNATNEEIYNDLIKAMNFDQSYLFKKVYEEEYGTFGGNPYTVLTWDFYLDRSDFSITLLEKMTEIAAAAHCPLILSASPKLFDLLSFEKLSQPYALNKVFDSIELVAYNTFRETDDAKYINIVLPRFMGRNIYDTKIIPIDGLNFQEKVSGYEKDDYLWVNSAYAYATKISNSYSKSGWFSSICGVENGGCVENLPVHIYKTINSDLIMQCPTEVIITDRREKELSDLGFISLCHSKNTNFSVFFGNNSVYKHPLFTSDNANANGELSSKAPYMLNVSRFAHYIKCMMRDKIGSFSSTLSVCKYLAGWLSNYTLLDDNASSEQKSKYPLRQFSVKVQEIIGKPGYYTSIVYFKPHDELQGIEVSLRLVVNIPK